MLYYILKFIYLLIFSFFSISYGYIKTIPHGSQIKNTTNLSQGNLFLPPGVLEFERLSIELKRKNNFHLVSNKRDISGLILVFGEDFAQKAKNGSSTIELFVAGNPINKTHRIIPYEAPISPWCKVFKAFNSNHIFSNLVILTTLRLKKRSDLLKASCPQFKISVKVVRNEKSALKYISGMFRNHKTNTGLKLEHDLSILTPRVLYLALKLQYRWGVPVFVRTKYEVLAGGIATVEPVIDSEYISSYLQTGELKKTRFNIFYNSHSFSSLQIRKDIIASIGGKVKSW